MSANLSTEVLQELNPSQAWHYRAIPLNLDDGKLMLATDNVDLKANSRLELELITGRKVDFLSETPERITTLLNKHYRIEGQSNMISVGHFNLDEGWKVESMLEEAVSIKASDVHIERLEDSGRIRFRIDGGLIEKYHIESCDYPGLVNKVKIRAGLDISEKRNPQDGRILLQANELRMDVRVSVLPSIYGEKIVMRLLNTQGAEYSLDTIGLEPDQLKSLKEAIQNPSGIILVSGPTGSGKSTTLFACLSELNHPSKNILTIEDPVEYTLRGVNQIQVNSAIDFSFAKALRSFLRQDPDIIMLGEIRDSETAKMAVRASLTGHLVLSTIHTNSAWSTISRLIDLGVPPYLLSETLRCSMAQRLVKKLCPKCKKTAEGQKGAEAGEGCDHCHYTGYSGRLALYEVIPIHDGLEEQIQNFQRSSTPNRAFDDVLSLQDHGRLRWERGETSYSEIKPYLAG